MTDDLALAHVQCGNLRLVVIVQLEVEDVQVLGHALGLRGFGQHHDAALDEPAGDDLRHGFAVFLADGGEHGVLEDAELAFGKRSPGFGHDAFREQPLHLLGLLVEGVDLDLVHRGHDLVEQAHVQHTVGGEVAQADGADPAACLIFLQRAPCAVDIIERLVQQHQVDVAAVQPCQRAIKRGLGGFVTVVLDPDLAGDEKLLTRNAAVPDALSDLGLVHVRLGGVDVAVACLHGIDHSLRGLFRWNLEDTEAENGDFHAVVEFECLHGDSPVGA